MKNKELTGFEGVREEMEKALCPESEIAAIRDLTPREGMLLGAYVDSAQRDLGILLSSVSKESAMRFVLSLSGLCGVLMRSIEAYDPDKGEETTEE